MLEVQSVNAAYGDLPALRDTSLSVSQGEIVALIGPNGAGKTTLLRTIVGLHRPTSGSILLEGNPIHTLPAHEISAHGIMLVPEGRRLFGGMTVLENLQVGAHTTRAHKQFAQSLARVYEIFPLLETRKHALASTLSGGQQQMVAIGRALMGVPRLLLLDEPSLGLAPLLVESILEVITRVNREGVTVLLVEQDAHAALELAHRAYILEEGHIVGQDTGAAMLANQQVRKAYLGYVENSV